MRRNMMTKAAVAAAMSLALFAGSANAAPLGNQFTYQGEVRSAGVPATGPVDLRFRLYDAAAGGALVGSPTEITAAGVGLVNGRFTRTLNFGAAAFSAGDARWLEIDVRNAGGGGYTTLPRQELTASPFARYAANAGTAVTAGSANTAGSATYSGAVQMFNSGTTNPDKCVMYHSPSFPGWGLWYNDNTDSFEIKTSSGGVPSLHVDVGGFVGIGTGAPSHQLTIGNGSSDDALRIIGTGSFGSLARFNIGDSDYVFISEPEDDAMEIHAADGVVLSTGDNPFGAGTPSHALTVSHYNNNNIRMIGPAGGSLGYDNAINWGDAEYVYIWENTDDHMLIHARLGVQCDVTFTAPTKLFTIDHPLDPANKTLSHSCVESDEYKNMYDGLAMTDDLGYATITMPDWFGALNENFRYQLTIVDEGEVSGDFVMARVVQKLDAKNTFVIKTSQPGVEVSWQITGNRKDAYVKAHPLEVQKDKVGELRGKYITPAEFGLPASMGMGKNAGTIDSYTKRAANGGIPTSDK